MHGIRWLRPAASQCRGAGPVGAAEASAAERAAAELATAERAAGAQRTDPPGRGQVAAEQAGCDMQTGPLSEQDTAILVFERRWWRYPGAKEQAIREVFRIPVTRYYQRLNELIDLPAALAFDPILVKRLRRQRAELRRLRSARRQP